MNLTLYLTEDCDLDCTYCTQEKTPAVMSAEVLKRACELAFSDGASAGLCFFGGEPLLCEDMIFEAMDICGSLSEKYGKPVYYRMTTNGTLLTDRMLERAAAEGMETALSFDGLMQDICRKYRSGRGTFADVEAAAKRLLAVLPASTAMMTAAPQAVGRFAASVRYLYDMGFRRIHAVPAYGSKVKWVGSAQEILAEQMAEAADFYKKCLLDGDPFYFSPIETKIRSLLSGINVNDRCHLGFSQMPVATDGNIYACNQFMGDEDYCLGNVYDGISVRKCAALALRRELPLSCQSCSFKSRCLNSCGCLNRLETGSEDTVSPFQCSYEKMLIHLADDTAAQLSTADPAGFESYFGH